MTTSQSEHEGLPIADLLRPDLVGPRLAEATGDESWKDFSAELIAGGKSNLTFTLRSDAGEVILRRPPTGKLLPSAHDMGREARIQLGLGGTDVIGAPDGLVLDSRNRPIVPANLLGEIWRVDGPNQYCALATGLPTSSSLAYGKGSSGFSEGRLFRVGFDGAIYEIPGGFDG